MLVCPLTLICKLSDDSHLSQSRAAPVPTAFSQKRATAPPNHPSLSFLKSPYPATAALQQCQLSHRICADKELSCHAPASARGLRHRPPPQTCRGAPSLGNLLWVVASAEPGVISPSGAGDHLRQLFAMAAEHRSTVSPDPVSLLHKLLRLLAAHHARWLYGLPQHQRRGCLTLTSQN